MDYTNIIIRPLLSEKVNKLSEINKQYVFEVSTISNKLQIKSAIEEKFEVKVKKVRTLNYVIPPLFVPLLCSTFDFSRVFDID